MSLLVKICGLSDAAGIDAAVAAGADALGFVFAESPRRVAPDDAARLARGLPAGLLRVAVMRHPSNEEWLEVARAFRPDVLQTDAADFGGLDVPEGVTRWPVLREGEALPVDVAGKTFVYEGRQSGRGQVVNWQTAAALAGGGRMILAGGLTPGNVAEAVATVAPAGVDVSSGVESAPGRKDPARIRAFIVAARQASRNLDRAGHEAVAE